MIDTNKYEGHSKTTKTGRWKRSATTGFKSESVFDESGEQIASVKLAGHNIKRVKETYANLLLITDAPLLLSEVKRLREESKKKGNVLSTLDEMIRNEENHVEMMKALEQGLDLPETWKEMV